MKKNRSNYLFYIIFIIFFIIILFYFINKYRNLIESFETVNIDDLQLYVISLRNQNRLDNITNQQERIKLPIEIFDAVKGDQLDINKLINENIVDSNFINGKQNRNREIGCYMSHLYIYNKIQHEQNEQHEQNKQYEQKKYKYTVVFEDDFNNKHDNLIDEIISIISQLNNANIDFDLIFLGNHRDNRGELVLNNIYKVSNDIPLYGTHAYIVNNKNINKIINELKYINAAIDNKIEYLSIDSKLNTYVIYPTIVDPLGIESTINT
jgi:GR25 family glycosyltransferase involved in LPS biosynthesis